MKERYTTLRPYGEWLEQETVSLQQLVDSVPAEQRVPPPVVPAPPSLSNGTSNGNGATAAVRNEPSPLCHLPWQIHLLSTHQSDSSLQESGASVHMLR